MYDLIGDIHGHADELVQLLAKLGYVRHRSVYRQPERKVIFLGDFIDRGPQIRQVLEIVWPMIDEGTALAVMGNHELNALAYHTQDSQSPGRYLRPHNPKNDKQHHQTIAQLNPSELTSCLEWFRTLPMWLDLDGLRVVHACWDEHAVKQIAQAVNEHGKITTAFLQSACNEDDTLFASVEIVLKGKETPLPNGIDFEDKDGNVRKEMRTRWYLSPHGQTYRTYAFQSTELKCDSPLEKSVIEKAIPYPSTSKPVFFGHYWLSDQCPKSLPRTWPVLTTAWPRGVSYVPTVGRASINWKITILFGSQTAGGTDQRRYKPMQQVLFLCSGNYYRSRFAEIYFNWQAEQRGLNWKAESRGLTLLNIHPGFMSCFTIDRLNHLGIPIDSYLRLPTKATLPDFDSADHIVAVKEAEHRPLVQVCFPKHLE